MESQNMGKVVFVHLKTTFLHAYCSPKDICKSEAVSGFIKPFPAISNNKIYKPRLLKMRTNLYFLAFFSHIKWLSNFLSVSKLSAQVSLPIRIDTNLNLN